MNTEIQSPSCPTPAPAGIKLFRRDGTPRKHFSASERLALLGWGAEEVAAFMKLFAPRRFPYILQRQRDGKPPAWRTVNHALTDDLIVRHLLADKLPGVNPIWVGTRAWDKTMFVAVDVDFRGDAPDFIRRCTKVERALYTLGIPRRSWLIQATPSGGRHYYFFTYRPIPTWEIPITLELVELVHIGGQHEVFPSDTQGLRLPFGSIPGQVHDPEAGRLFIRAYVSGEFPRVNWRRCKNRASRSAQRRLEGIGSATPVPARPRSPKHEREQPALPLGVPKAQRCSTEQGRTTTSRPATRPKDIEDLWQRGITAAGARLEATKKVAWNFIFVRGMSEEEAANEIIDWVYRNGKTTSNDVKADLKNNTRRVAEQTRRIVAWYAARRREGGSSGSRRFSRTEIDAIVAAAASLPATLQPARIHFAIDFLNFAKREGTRHGDGWGCCPSVRGIIRKWKNCSGIRYRPHLTWALEVGLIEMIREKRQSKNGKGRARTYAIYVPHSPLEERTLSYAHAIEYADQRVLAASDGIQVGHGEGDAE
jgi:hypothetical protein